MQAFKIAFYATLGYVAATLIFMIVCGAIGWFGMQILLRSL